MSELSLTKTRLFDGIWEGALHYEGEPGPAPKIDVTFLGETIDGVAIDTTDTPNTWRLRFPIPKESLADGVQTLLITNQITGKQLDKLSFVAGEALADDLRAEIDLLRAELDMLKRAFRRHCVETM
ncbi:MULTISPECIES: hypothetical protein [unclassified Shimia]|uniref:hypothetical protein n=1 Tax=unclassified Shimia TaxID=2630038 RepID=UPI001ADAE2D9|nr:MULTISPECIES: hypothetical protein [unclassified Shimia]MBO9472961.1 hypothetical protein [Shimia sp. R10_1]MDA5556656.1 hypothetical protein [Shimia sp. MMG029]